MSSHRLVECSFFIPLRRDAEISDGKRHSNTAWAWLDDSLYEAFDAYTLAPGEYEGTWRSPKTGKPIKDQSYRFLIALPKRKVPTLRRILREACRVFGQQCIYLSVAGTVELIEPDHDTSEELH